MACSHKEPSDIEQGLEDLKKSVQLDQPPAPPRREDDEEECTTMSGGSSRHLSRIWVIVSLIVVLGCAASAAFLTIGVTSAIKEQEDQFERSASDLVSKIESAWEDYVHAASIIHGRCRRRDFTRADFRELYEYITSDGLEFQAAQFDPNITHAEREYYENEARQFYKENYPHVNYTGLRGFNTESSTKLEPRWEAPFYFPIHYMEPIIGNEVCTKHHQQRCDTCGHLLPQSGH